MPGRGLWPALAALVVLGCASVTAMDGQRYALGSDDFRGYAERVFRAQNSVLSELAFALDDAGLAAAVRARLDGAEDELIAACESLNEVATRRRDARDTGLGLGLKAAKSVPECERAVAAAESALAATRS